ncbi:MAG TPA: hypothetical protein VGP72_14730 [Planctomycetota bacterium]
MSDFLLNLKLSLADYKAGLAEAGSGLTGFVSTAQGTLTQLSSKFAELGNGLASVLKRASAEAASDESIDRRFTKVFGEASAAAGQFAEQTATAFARTGGEVKNFMVNMQFTAQQFGLSKSAALDMTQQTVKLAQSLSALSGESFDQTSAVIQMALQGNTRGLKAFGIGLDETKEKEAAWAKGLDLDSLNEQEKALLRLDIITKAVGTSTASTNAQEKTFARVLQELGTNVSELFSDIGRFVNDAVKPYVQAAADAAAKTREWVKENPALTSAITTAATVLGGLVATVQLAPLAMRVFTTTMTAVTSSIDTFVLVVGAGISALEGIAAVAYTALGPIGLLMLGIMALATAWTAFATRDKGTGVPKVVAQDIDALNAENAAFDESTFRLDRAIKAREKLKETEKDFAALVSKTANEMVRVRSGETAAMIDGAQRETAAIIKSLQDRKTAERDAMDASAASMEEFKKRGGAQTENDKAALERLEADYGKHAGAMSDIDKTIGQQRMILADKIKKIEKDAAADAVSAERAREDARVRATKTLDDDIKLMQQRHAEDLKGVVGVDRDLLARKQAAELGALTDEQQRRADEERKDRVKSTGEAAKAAEDSLADARAKSSGKIIDELLLLDQRTEKELAAAKSADERANIEKKWAADEAKLLLEEENRKKDATKRAAEAAVSAEDAVKAARAAATDSLQDDIDLLRERRDRELALAKSEAERGEISKKYLMEEIRLVEEKARKEKEEDARKKGALNDWVQQQQNQADRRGGKGAVVDVREAAKGAQDQIKNITDTKGLNDFKKAADQALSGTLQNAHKEAVDAQKAFEQAQAALRGQKFGSKADRQAAQQNVADLKAQAQAKAKAEIEAAQLAEKERSRLQALADDQFKKEQAKQAELAKQKKEAGAGPDAAKPGAPGQPAKAEDLPAQVSTLTQTAGAIATAMQSLITALTQLPQTLAAVTAQIAAALPQAGAQLPDISGGLNDLVTQQQAFGGSLAGFCEAALDKFAAASASFQEAGGRLNDNTSRLAAIEMKLNLENVARGGGI